MNYAGLSTRRAGFTLLEVLVALFIVAAAMGAGLRAVGSLTRNSGDLRVSMMATWSAENRMSQIRLAREWPGLGSRTFECPQADLEFTCEENVFATPNPLFRRVEVNVFGANEPTHRITRMVQLVPQ